MGKFEFSVIFGHANINILAAVATELFDGTVMAFG